MADCKRLARIMSVVFPSSSEKNNLTALQYYRLSRDNNGPDWEGLRARFVNVVRASIRRRHVRKDEV